MSLDLLCINPGGREAIYQDLGEQHTAVEPPLWSRLIAGYCRDKGHTVQILDSEAMNLSPWSAAMAIHARTPKLICLVVYGHQPSASTQQMHAAGEIVRHIKKFAPYLKIIIVGGHVAALPQRTIREEHVDFACNSEGPVTVERLLTVLKAGDVTQDTLRTVPGLVWGASDQEVHANEPPPLLNVDELSGDTWDLLPMTLYRSHDWQCFGDLSKRRPYASIYTSLGCPFKCSFCCINAPFRSNRYRMRKPADVVAEIDMLHRTYGVSTFKVIDELFILNERHYIAICEGLAALPYASELNLWCYGRVDTIKPEHLALLRRAGIRWLALGIESASEHVRDGAEKAINSDDIRETVSAIRAAGINVLANFIFGLPDDTRRTMMDTLDLALDLNCEFFNAYSAMAYPGSRLYDEAVANKTPLPERWSGYSQHSADCHPLPTATLSSAEVLEFRDYAFQTYFASPRYLDMIVQKFGQSTLAHIHKMTGVRLKRNLLAPVE